MSASQPGNESAFVGSAQGLVSQTSGMVMILRLMSGGSLHEVCTWMRASGEASGFRLAAEFRGLYSYTRCNDGSQQSLLERKNL